MFGPSSSPNRTIVGFVTLVATLCALVLLPAAQATSPKPASDYLALGDSLAFGYQAAKFRAEYPNIVPSTFDTGYVDVFGSWLQSLKRPIDTTNYGCPGESSDSFRFGGRGAATNYSFVPNAGFCGDQPAAGVGAIFNKAWLHDFYGGSQLDAALAFLRKHPHTSPITLDIGANDTLILLEQCGFGSVPNCVTPATIGNLYARIAGNVAASVAALRGAAPRAEIIVLGLYNPYPTVLPGGDMLTKALNTTLRSVVTGLGADFADPLPVFNPASVSGGSEIVDIPSICLFTNMCPGGIFNPASPFADIHPTDIGYATLASILAAASPYEPGLTP
jgi:lysophospholipase L1-like esterase